MRRELEGVGQKVQENLKISVIVSLNVHEVAHLFLIMHVLHLNGLL